LAADFDGAGFDGAGDAVAGAGAGAAGAAFFGVVLAAAFFPAGGAFGSVTGATGCSAGVVAVAAFLDGTFFAGVVPA
jgi:hypothetical protein